VFQVKLFYLVGKIHELLSDENFYLIQAIIE
jgi:hypothetical protein